MKKIITVLAFCMILQNSYAFQTESNHSYIKNANLINDFEVNFAGYGDVKAFQFNFDGDKFNKMNADVSVDISIENKTDDVNTYGLKTSLNFNSDFNKEQNFGIFYKDFWGRIELGNMLSAAEQSRIGGNSIGIGSSSVFNNDFTRFFLNSVNDANLSAYNTLLGSIGSIVVREGTLSSQSFGYINAAFDLDEIDKSTYAPKINYFSPEYKGFQFFASYSPDNKVRREDIGMGSTATPTPNDIIVGDVYSYGLSYINTFGNFGIAASVLQEKNMKGSSNKNNDIDIDIDSIIGGVNVNYFGFTLSASAGRLKRDPTEKGLTNTLVSTFGELDNTYYNYGATYEISNVAVNYNYFTSESKDVNKYTSNNVAVEYKLNKNASVYGEYVDFKLEDLKATATQKSVEGKAIFAGLLISFY